MTHRLLFGYELFGWEKRFAGLQSTTMMNGKEPTPEVPRPPGPRPTTPAPGDPQRPPEPFDPPKNPPPIPAPPQPPPIKAKDRLTPQLLVK
jgi:hypothetical protein